MFSLKVSGIDISSDIYPILGLCVHVASGFSSDNITRLFESFWFFFFVCLFLEHKNIHVNNMLTDLITPLGMEVSSLTTVQHQCPMLPIYKSTSPPERGLKKQKQNKKQKF